jgi:hypothetical protein
VLLLLLCSACNKTADADAADAEAAAELEEITKPPPDLPRKRLLVAFSGMETDPWTSAVAGSLGRELHFDPWAVSDADEFFDYFGDYDVKSRNLPLDLRIVLTGMDSISGLERQQAAARHLLEIAKDWKPDLVWLDGDQLQYSAGRLLLDNEYQLVFSGLAHDSALYYEGSDNAAGFYRRHSVSGTMGRIWRDNREAMFHCIITDDSPEGRRRLVEFTDAEDLLGEGSTLHVLPLFSAWDELQQAIASLPPEADDLIIVAAGETGSSMDLLSNEPPENILAECPVPIYVLGPGVLDMLGCTSLIVNPGAQVHEVLTVLEANLGKGIPMSSIPTIVPEDMQLRISESAPSSPSPVPQ